MIQLKDIIKTGRIIKISPEETISHAFSQMRTSHDAAFVFDGKDNFLGLINPYYALIKSSYPGNAKVKHCLYHPPKLKINSSINKVAQLFIESKIHYLPVFDDQDRFLGIIEEVVMSLLPTSSRSAVLTIGSIQFVFSMLFG